MPIGQGYPLLVSAKLGAERPGEYDFYNAGVSGSRVVDLYARIKADAWNKAPDIISILIGANDVWHELGELKNGVDAVRFERIYRMLLSDTLLRCPNVKFLLLEPFVLRTFATDAKWETFRSEISLRALAVKKLSEEFNTGLVLLQSIFDQACSRAPAAYWLGDGIHATPAGHQLIAEAWLQCLESIR